MKTLLPQLLAMSAGLAVNVAAFKLPWYEIPPATLVVAAIAMIACTLYGMAKRRAW